MARVGYFRGIATLWLRVISFIFLLYALLGIVATPLYLLRPVSGEPRRALFGTVLWGIAGAVLWGLSGALGRIAAKGLDDPESTPPAA